MLVTLVISIAFLGFVITLAYLGKEYIKHERQSSYLLGYSDGVSNIIKQVEEMSAMLIQGRTKTKPAALLTFEQVKPEKPS